MRFYVDLEKRKEIIRNFIRKNPQTTFKEIKEKLHTKIDKVYAGGMEEAFLDASISPPRTFKTKTKDEKRKIVINYIRKHPLIGGHKIRKNTRIKI